MNPIKSLIDVFQFKPIPYKPIDVVSAFGKIERVLESSYIPEHIDVADNMFINLLRRYNFKQEDYESPIIIGMHEKINSRRAELVTMWEKLNYHNEATWVLKE
jgi:hypothetical protein